MERAATPSGRTRSSSRNSVTQVKTRSTRVSSASSDEHKPKSRQGKVTCKSKQGKNENLLETNGKSSNKEDLKSKSLNGEIQGNCSEPETRNNSQDETDTQSSIISNLSTNQNIPVTKVESQVEECKRPVPDCLSENNDGIITAGKIRGDESESSEDQPLIPLCSEVIREETTLGTEVVMEETMLSSEVIAEGSTTESKEKHGQKNNNDLDLKASIQEFVAGIPDNSTNLDGSQTQHLDTALVSKQLPNNPTYDNQLFTISTDDKSQDSQSIGVKSNEPNLKFLEQESSSRTENIIEPDTLETNMELNIEEKNKIETISLQREILCGTKDSKINEGHNSDTFERNKSPLTIMKENTNEVISVEKEKSSFSVETEVFKKDVSRNVFCDSECIEEKQINETKCVETCVDNECDKECEDVKLKSVENLSADQLENVISEGESDGNFDLDSLNHTNHKKMKENTNEVISVEKEKSSFSVKTEVFQKDVSRNVFCDSEYIGEKQINETNCVETGVDNECDKECENVKLKSVENLSANQLENAISEGESDGNLDLDSLNHTNHKKFRRKNEYSDDLHYVKEIQKSQESLMDQGDCEIRPKDESSGDKIVIEDSTSSNTSDSYESSNPVPSENTANNSCNIMNDTQHNYEVEGVLGGDNQCHNTNLDSIICQPNVVDDNVYSECITKGDTHSNMALDANSFMVVDAIPETKYISEGNDKPIDYKSTLDIDVDTNENISTIKTEMDIPIKTDANGELKSQSPTVNELTPGKISDQELCQSEGDCFIDGEEPTMIENISNRLGTSNSYSNLANGIYAMSVDPEPQNYEKKENENVSKDEFDENCDIQYKEQIDKDHDKNENDSNSDIYKNMSDVGSEHFENKDGDLYDLSSSSGQYFNDPAESEECVSTDDREDQDPEEIDEEENFEDDDDEGEEDEHEEEKEANKPVTGEGDKSREKEAPLTYDQALAILNKNRVKKIDDEEFFDMFTQELNRVSDAPSGGSDSDIAIVDEYLMEPDEIEEKPNAKPPKNTPSQRANQQNHNMAPGKNFQFSQPGASSQHPHPNIDMSKLDYSQGMYQPYNQGIQPINEPIMAYDHYGPGPSNVAHMAGFNPQMHSGIPYSRPIYNPHMNSMGTMPYPRPPPIRLRLMGSQNQRNVDTGAVQENAHQGISGPRFDPDGNIPNTVNIVSGDKNDQDQNNYGPDKSSDQSTPVLNLLGLNKEKLVLLKHVLGLDKSTDKLNLRDNIIPNMISLPNNKERETDQHRKRDNNDINIRSPTKNSKKTKRTKSNKCHSPSKLLLQKRIYYLEKIVENYSKMISKNESRISPWSTSDITSSSDDFREREPKSREFNQYSCKTSGKTKGIYKQVHHPKKKFRPDVNLETSETPEEETQEKQSWNYLSKGKDKKALRPKRSEPFPCDSSSSTEIYTEKKRLNRKPKSRKTRSDSSVSYASEECEFIKKMVKTRSGAETSPVSNHSVMVSSSGKFKVDSMEKSISSEGQSDDPKSPVIKKMRKDIREMKRKYSMLTRENISSDNEYVEEMKRKIKTDISAEKAKNIFAMAGVKGTKRKIQKENSEHKVKKAKKIMKLPASVLEKLANRVLTDSETRDSETSEEVERTKKRKRTKKIKVKSMIPKHGYIPYVEAGTSTQFGLQRLDLDDSLALAQSAADFRQERLYGSAVRRISSKELASIRDKKRRNDLAAQRKIKS